MTAAPRGKGRGAASDRLTHVDRQGRAAMVDVSSKRPTHRAAVARAEVRMLPGTLSLIVANQVAKGDVLTAAEIAGVMAAKRTHELIPLCHPLPLTEVRVIARPDTEAGVVSIQATVRTVAATGVEMEALVAASVAALTVYDMCKSADRGMTVEGVRLVHKRGGRSGRYDRPGERR